MEVFPLTFFQQALWDTLDYLPENVLILSCVMFFDRKLNNELLKQAVNRVIMNNDGLRIRFIKNNNEINQFVSAYRKIDVEVCDFRGRKELSFLDDWMQKEDGKPLSFFNGDLFIFKILDFDETSACFVKANHLICDGWSFSLIKQQLEEEYRMLAEQAVTENRTRASFLACMRNQLDYLKSDKFHKNVEYWMYKIRPPISATGFKPALLAKDRMQCGYSEFVLPESIYEKLERFSAEHQISILVFYLSIMALYLARVNSGRDVMLGTNYHNRRTPEEQNTIGYFSVMLPLRIQIDDEMNVLQFMKKVAGELKSGVRNCFISRQVLNLLKEEVIKLGLFQETHADNGGNQADDHGIFRGLDTVVSFESYHSNERIRYSRKSEEFFQLSIRISLMERELVFEIIYLLALFRHDEIQRMYDNIFKITQEVLDSPGKRLSELVFQ